MRIHKIPTKPAASIRLDDLDQLITYLDKTSSLKNKRDKALLLIVFFGAFRRSKLSSLQWCRPSKLIILYPYQSMS